MDWRTRSVTEIGSLVGLLDIKEVLLFPAMKPELGQMAPTAGVTTAGPTGEE